MKLKDAEAIFGPIKTTCNCPPIPIRSLDWSAYFDRYNDYDAPSWSRADAATEAEAITELLEQAEDHFLEHVFGRIAL